MIDTIFNNINSWNFSDEKHANNTIHQLGPVSSEDSNFALESSLWMEPLETIISDTVSSSRSVSPVSSSDTVPLFAQVDSLRTKEDRFAIKQENYENIIVPPVLLKSTSPITAKKRAPRKRLTTHQKQAHNKIEKRYRVNINTKIAKLQQTIPWVTSDQTAFEVSESLKKNWPGNNVQKSKISNVALPVPSSMIIPPTTRLNKSIILEKAVEYIEYLQNNEVLYEQEVQRLRSELDSEKKKNQTYKAEGR
ncbi:hypothetical protein TPHA_0N00390 [Tetrapisispora phaffii CBS 4417]|uniref:BHLH domain-containing protein n=1 Tax=Tetrapisispora phaffii (strain ATCC 24235 / CBS 4417 / NBRC 1672 / NRRL Y-8282 / UCD 70-5) TaxID=1071381 RepID=G8C0Z1_TETPH|nr:hypothetical protein TPHA_0N00390 [Tetrapisispora phaffii CBS 4417]CCE65819.1 hypothetical protein TPHA_0N00390 [Tetrapisispora phaffii CBS 4417]